MKCTYERRQRSCSISVISNQCHDSENELQGIETVWGTSPYLLDSSVKLYIYSTRDLGTISESYISHPADEHMGKFDKACEYAWQYVSMRKHCFGLCKIIHVHGASSVTSMAALPLVTGKAAFTQKSGLVLGLILLRWKV